MRYQGLLDEKVVRNVPLCLVAPEDPVVSNC